MSGGMRCPQCGITGDNMQQHPSIAAWMHCTACGCVTHKKYLGTPTAPEPAAAPQVDLEDARRLADDGLEPFDLRRCTRRLADELDAHRARHAELVALVADLRNEATAAPKAATRVAMWKYHDRLACILGEQP